jgi:hypothetical protein
MARLIRLATSFSFIISACFAGAASRDVTPPV